MSTTVDHQTTRYFAERNKDVSATQEPEPYFPLTRLAAKIGSGILAGLRALGEHSAANMEVHDRITGRIHQKPDQPVRSCL